MATFWQDFSFGIRTAIRNPIFSLVVIVTLAFSRLLRFFFFVRKRLIDLMAFFWNLSVSLADLPAQLLDLRWADPSAA